MNYICTCFSPSGDMYECFSCGNIDEDIACDDFLLFTLFTVEFTIDFKYIYDQVKQTKRK